MWGRNGTVRLLSAAFVALGLAGACGGRSARQVPVETDETGGTGSGGSNGLLRPCGAVPVPAELLPSCRFALGSIPSERPIDPELLTFTLREGGTAELVERVEAGPCSVGWQLSEDGTTVVLCDHPCEALRDSNGATLEIAYACDGPPPRN